MNVVATADGELVEVQGTAEGAPFRRDELDALLDLALGGIADLTALQADALASRCRSRAAALHRAADVGLVTPVRARDQQRRQGRRAAADPRAVRARAGRASTAAYEPGPETGATFEENALAKAREAVRHTGLPAVADDSGLAVDALNGMPGVLSARWAGRHGDDRANLELLLGQLADVPDERRGGGFVCAAAWALPGRARGRRARRAARRR